MVDGPRCEGDEQQNNVNSKTDELRTILLIVNLSSLVLQMNKHAEYV